MLTRLAFTNFRCFRDRQELRLRPVTVVLGKNNSGKSAFTRAAMVFHAGLPDGAPTRRRGPLNLDQLAPDSVASFTDLVHQHRPHGSIAAELTFDDPEVRSLSVEIQNIAERRLEVVSRVEIGLRAGRLLLEWMQEGAVYRQTWTDPNGVRNDGSGATAVGVVEFDGLVPRRPLKSAAGPYPEDVPDLARACAAAFGRISYLSPFRSRPRREHYLPNGEPHEVGDQGQHLAAILADDQVRHEGRIRRRMNELLREVLPDWQLDEVPDGRLFATVLRSRTDPHLSVNITDAGSGVTQILPILAQQALDEVTADHSPGLHIVEEPELHLHPAAHAQLADLYLRAADRTGNRFLIETHSESLLLRLRRRIAEGDWVSPDDVGIYFVHHDGLAARAEEITVDEAGRLSSWPAGVFTEDFDEVRALAAAQLRRSGADVA